MSKTIKLLAVESTIYEGFKAGKTYAEIREEYGIDRITMGSKTTKLVRHGALSRSGSKKSGFSYSAQQIEYEIIPDRTNAKDLRVEIDDPFVDDLQSLNLAPDQLSKIKKYIKAIDAGKIGRYEVSKLLGIPKLQLNAAIGQLRKDVSK